MSIPLLIFVSKNACTTTLVSLAESLRAKQIPHQVNIGLAKVDKTGIQQWPPLRGRDWAGGRGGGGNICHYNLRHGLFARLVLLPLSLTVGMVAPILTPSRPRAQARSSSAAASSDSSMSSVCSPICLTTVHTCHAYIHTCLYTYIQHSLILRVGRRRAR